MALNLYHRVDKSEKRTNVKEALGNDHQIKEVSASVSVCVSAVTSCFDAEEVCSSDNRD
jgi:hypothetical protein